nr:protein-glutamate O-methyltransferase CheR [Eubacterium sp.]
MMTEVEFYQIATFLKDRYGIDMSAKKEIMNGRLENYLRAGRWKDYTEYFRAVQQDETGELEKELVNLLTTNHTYFMREFEHFDFLREEVLPWLRQKESRNRDLCIWCGASSTGEEPYTLAMLMLDFFGLEHDSWDTKVLATDISTEVLQQALSGIYRKEQVMDLPGNWRRRFFRELRDGQQVQVTEEVKKEVIFRQFNLMDPFPFRRKMHIVFLRNVMIYFDQDTKRELVQKVYDAMEPGGYLFVGRTETIDRGETPFQMIQPSIFRK